MLLQIFMTFAVCANAGTTKCRLNCPSVPIAPAALQSLPGLSYSCSRVRVGALCLTGDKCPAVIKEALRVPRPRRLAR